MPDRDFRRDTWYGSGDSDDPPEIREDHAIETFEVLYTSPGDPTRFSASGGQFRTLEAARAAAEAACGPTVQWQEQQPPTMNARPKTARCPCCQSLTLSERDAFEICPVCYWEDDGQNEDDADQVRGGPNGTLSLRAARHNFYLLGASHPSHLAHVRPPKRGEPPSSPFPDAWDLSKFVLRIADELETGGNQEAASRLREVQSAGWSTGSEWLGELGSAVRWIEKTNKVAPTIRRGLMRIMDAAHIAWPRI